MNNVTGWGETGLTQDAVKERVPFWYAARWLLLADIVLLGSFAISRAMLRFGVFEAVPTSLDIGKENSVASFVIYLKFLVLVCVLGLIFRATQRWMFASFAIVFGYLFLDDYFELHERGGARLVEAFDVSIAMGLKTQDLGELAVWSVSGGLCIGLILLSILNTDQPAKRVGYTLLMMIFALAAAGIGMDMLHSAVGLLGLSVPGLSLVIAVLEDGGELIVVSVLLAYALGILRTASKFAPAPATAQPNSASTPSDPAAEGGAGSDLSRPGGVAVSQGPGTDPGL